MENDSRKCFLIAVEKRGEATLLPIIEKWIEPGTVIISDCWKAYCNLEKYGYRHFTVNHSKELVNAAGQSTKFRSFRLQVVSPTGRFAYTEVDSPTQVKSIPLHK